MKKSGIPSASNAVIQQVVNSLNSNGLKNRWQFQSTDSGSMLLADFKFKSFTRTWDFLNYVAKTSHELEHHPKITTLYNKVNLEITTHDSNDQVTEKDLAWARAVEGGYKDALNSSFKFGSQNDVVINLHR